jgi:hypothetical protein
MADRTGLRVAVLAVVHHMADGLSDARGEVLAEAEPDEISHACTAWWALRDESDAVQADGYR